MEYDHKGVKITVDDKGSFKAELPNGKKVTTSSLAAMKKKIDDMTSRAFTPFRAILAGNCYTKTPVLEYDVLEIVKRQGHYSYRIRSVDTESYGTHSSYVIPDTPENRAACEAYWNADKLYHSEIIRLRQLRDEAEKKLERKYPVDKK